jgi:hypothetical protein
LPAGVGGIGLTVGMDQLDRNLTAGIVDCTGQVFIIACEIIGTVAMPFLLSLIKIYRFVSAILERSYYANGSYRPFMYNLFLVLPN